MKPSASKKRQYILLLALFISPGLILLLLSKADHHFATLPFYGEREPIYTVSGEPATDTLYHTVPPFEFTNQDGKPFSSADVDGKIKVVDYFFTTCPTICPVMTKQMERLQWLIDDPAYNDVVLLSHTVNPEYDTPEVLRAYAEKNNANLEKWVFLTGDRNALYKQGVKGYLIPAQEDALAPGGFLHSEQFVLVDKQNHIRGYYDGTRSEEIDRLLTDIKMLLKEEKMTKAKAQS